MNIEMTFHLTFIFQETLLRTYLKLAWMVELVFRNINLHMKIHAEIPHKVHVVQNLHSKVLKCLYYCQTSHHFQMEFRHKGTLVYAHNIENPEKVAGI